MAANRTAENTEPAKVCLFRYIERIKKDFLENGGIKEQMFKARVDYRDQQKHGSGEAKGTGK